MIFLDDFMQLFSGMSVVVFAFLIAGLSLIVVEFYQPTKGIFGICGALLIAAGITLRMLANGTFAMLFMMVFFVCFICFTAHMVMLSLQKKGWLTHSLTLALTKADDEVRTNYTFLIGHEGIASTEIRYKGHMLINDINFLVVSNEAIAKGMPVTVIDVDNDRIVVQPSSLVKHTDLDDEE